MCIVWHQRKVRSQSFTQSGFIVIVADIKVLTHREQKKRERTLAARLHVEKKIDLMRSRFSTRNWPIISEMAGEFLKCENVSLDIYHRQWINDINKTFEWWLFPSSFPLHSHTKDKIVFLRSKLLTQKLWTLSKHIQRECVFTPLCTFQYVCLCMHTDSIHLKQWFKGWPVYHKHVLFDIWLNSITANQHSKMLNVGSQRLRILSVTVDRLQIISPNKNVHKSLSVVYTHNQLIIHDIMCHNQDFFLHASHIQDVLKGLQLHII